jgi:hypothetical protein
MSDPNFEHSDGNWDETPSDPNWNEYQWRKYLNGSDQDTARFLAIYHTLKHKPNHLDEVAVHMGWDAEDISLTDEFSAPAGEEETENRLDANDNAPYTLHRHPVIVVTRALYRDLHQSWEHYMEHSQNHLSPQLCWGYANSLHQAEINVLLAIQALDLGDFGLTICHLKNSLNVLNQTFALLNQLTHPDPEYLARFQSENHIRLFDLREMWIRVMSDCRVECNRRPDRDQD